jgi:hypothetical protein
MRSEKELIQLFIDSEQLYKECGFGGICGLSIELFMRRIISHNELVIMRKIINDNKPLTPHNNYFYFKPMQWQPRKEYLENLLKKYE